LKKFWEKTEDRIWVNKTHNHAIYEKGYYIKEGATPAKKERKE